MPEPKTPQNSEKAARRPTRMPLITVIVVMYLLGLVYRCNKKKLKWFPD